MEFLQLSQNKNNVHCPYNNAHTMPSKTLIKHIIKCPDKPPHFKNCRYNMKHAMPASELKSHEQSCPNRILLDTAFYQEENIVRPNVVMENTPTMQYEETWDNLDSTCDTFNAIQTKIIPMKATHNITPSERRQHRSNLHKNDVDSNQHKECNEDKRQQNNKFDTKPLTVGKRPNKKN